MIHNIDNLRIIKAKSVENINDNQFYLMRGGPLDHIDKKDKNNLFSKYNLKTVVDFRSAAERKSCPNKIIEGVDYFNLEVLDPKTSVHKNPMEFLQAYEDGDKLNFMEEMYSEFVLNEFSRNSYGKFLDIVSKSKGSIFFHCTAGKDRTGFASMLLLEILGATEVEIYDDYLMTNDFTDDNYKLILNKLRYVYNEGVEDNHLKGLIGVKDDYLKTSRDLIFKNYDSVIDFIKKDLNITEETLQLIRNKFIV